MALLPRLERSVERLAGSPAFSELFGEPRPAGTSFAQLAGDPTRRPGPLFGGYLGQNGDPYQESWAAMAGARSWSPRPAPDLAWVDLADQQAADRWKKAHPSPQNTGPGSAPQPGPRPSSPGQDYDGAGVSQWIAGQRPGSPIAPIAPEIIAYAAAKGVDPALIFGQLQAESGWATDGAAGTVRNNPGNIMAPGADPAHGKIILREYPTMLDGVKAMVDAVASYNGTYGRRFAPDTGQLTLEQMIAIYYVGPEAYARYGLQANDAGGQGPGGNGTVQDYLDRHIYPVRQALEPFKRAPVPRPGEVRAPAGGPPTPELAAGTRPWTQAPGILGAGQQFLGQPYVWGGENPQEGFDCSGLVQWSLAQIGIRDAPRTAQQQYDWTQRIQGSELRPGDLIFFTGTYDTTEAVTHVGIFAGYDSAGRPIMLNSASGGIVYADFSQPYWQQHLYGYGRIPHTGPGGRP